MNRISPILKTAFRQVTKVFDCSQPIRAQQALSEQPGGGSQVMLRAFRLTAHHLLIAYPLPL